jgi:hypothetical protein
MTSTQDDQHQHHGTSTTTPPRDHTRPPIPPGRIFPQIEYPETAVFIRWQTMKDRARRLHQPEPAENEPLAPISPVEPFLVPPDRASFPPISKH